MIHKAIKGYEDYLVTDDGRVYSLKSNKYIKQQNDKYGYKMVSLFCGNGKYKHQKVHRLVAQAFIPNPNNCPTVDHINRVRDDNRVENLRWATISMQLSNRTWTEKRIKQLEHASKLGSKALQKPIIHKVNDEVSVGYLDKTTCAKVLGICRDSLYRKDKTFKCKGETFIQ